MPGGNDTTLVKHHNALGGIHYLQKTMFNQVDTIMTPLDKNVGLKKRSKLNATCTQCFNCHRDGHFASKCPERRTSLAFFNCGTVGHLSSECPWERHTTLGEHHNALGEIHHLQETPFYQVDTITTPLDEKAGNKKKMSKLNATCIECFNCHKHGHFASKCPEEHSTLAKSLACFTCGKVRPSPSECPREHHTHPFDHHNTSGKIYHLQAMPFDRADTLKTLCDENVGLEKKRLQEVTCFRCRVKGHYANMCTKVEESACRRCGEVGHYQHQCTASCPNCDEDHPTGECPVLSITCHLCEGQDHSPKECPVKPILVEAIKVRRCLQASLHLATEQVDKLIASTSEITE